MPNPYLINIPTTPKSVTQAVDVYLQGSDDFLIPLVFPDYEITVDEAQQRSFLGVSFVETIKIPYLGHAGVLLVNGNTGLTKYYEYGRYLHANPPGIVRRGALPDCRVVNGQITETSLKKVLKTISVNHGHSGNISGVVLRGDFFDDALKWLKGKVAENSIRTREPYDLYTHNCMTFVIDLADHLELDPSWQPPVVIPTAYMEQFQLTEVDLDYDFETDTLEVSD